ncbi:MAG: DnaB-like helicase C-terminal domain-containing protein, partial [Kiritimatiellia bacterium]|nr:DnaB-like helicase C-terminal domain-containing protein [Kiritimatiellia bacterium]
MNTADATEQPNEFEQAYSRLVDCAKHAEPLGLSTGLKEVDRVLGGLRPGSLTVLTARPTTGKSALAMNIALNIALGRGEDSEAHRVCVFALDDDRDSYLERMLCIEARCASHMIERGHISGPDVERLKASKKTLATAPFSVIGHPFPGTDWIRSRLRSEVNESGVELFLLDAAQRIHLSDGKYPQLDDDLRRIKNEIRDLEVPMLVLSDLCQPEDAKDSSCSFTHLCDLGV